MSLFKLGTVDLTYVKVKINISIEYYLTAEALEHAYPA